MALDYFLLVFIASIGVFQIASITAGLKGLWFFSHAEIQCIFGILAIVGAFGWFFTSSERNIQHQVEGTQQLGLFLAAIILAYFVTALVASLIQARVSSRGANHRQGKQHEQGMETLKTTTLLGGILSSLRRGEEEDS